MPTLFKRAAARRDLIEHAVYLATEGGEELAERFLFQAEASCAALLEQPQMGSLLVVRDPDLAGIRKWPVKDFESFLIFYLPHDRGVTIVRVLYARQDWWGILGVTLTGDGSVAVRPNPVGQEDPAIDAIAVARQCCQ